MLGVIPDHGIAGSRDYNGGSVTVIGGIDQARPAVVYGLLAVMMALVFVPNPNDQPLTVRIPSLLSTYGQEYHLLSAAAFLLMIVPLIVFFSLQRYFVQGLLAGSVKT